MNFRHQVHIGHQDEIETLNGKKPVSVEQAANSVPVKQPQQVTSSGNSTLSSRSLSFKDDDDSDQPLE